MQLDELIRNSPVSIVIADDDDDDVEFFTEAVHAVAPQIKITRASDGIELIDILNKPAEKLPILIFLDLNMPRKNGFEALEAIKASEQWRKIPILIYSTSAHIDYIDATYKNGANLYIQKPHDYKDIKKMVRKLFTINIENLIGQPIRTKYLFGLG